jgi:NADH-quinone oxidoreductase subunit D
MLEDRYLADLPIVVAAIDPCFSCTDRLISVVDLESEKKGIMNWRDLRNYSVEWYKKRGVDFSRMSSRGGSLPAGRHGAFGGKMK